MKHNSNTRKRVKYFCWLLFLSLFLPDGFGYHVGNLFVIDRRLLLLLAALFLMRSQSVRASDPRIVKYGLVLLLTMTASIFFSPIFLHSVLNLAQFFVFSLYIGYLTFRKFTLDDYHYLIEGLIYTFFFLSLIVISERIVGNTWYYNLFAANVRMGQSGANLFGEDVRLGLRAQGPFGHPIFASVDLAAIASITLVKTIFSKERRRKYALFLFSNLAGIYSTSSRAGILAVIFVSLIIFFLTLRSPTARKNLRYGLVICAVVLALSPRIRHTLFVLTVGGIFPQYLSSYDYEATEAWNLQGRLTDARIAFEDIRQYGLFGVGQGVVSNQARAREVLKSDVLLRLIGVYPYYLSILVENGLFGLLAFMAFLVYLFRKLWVLHFAKVGELQTLALMALAFLLVYTIGWVSVNYAFESFLFFPLMTISKFSRQDAMVFQPNSHL